MFFLLPVLLPDVSTVSAVSTVSTAQLSQPSAPPSPTPAPLTLEAVFDAVNSAYPKLIGADAERRMAAAKRREKQGAFDITPTLGTEFQRYNSASLRGKAYTYSANTAAVETTLRSGVKLIAGREFSTGTVKSPLSSTGGAGAFFAGAKIPVLRGSGVNEKTVGERQAILGIPLAARGYETVRLGALLGAAVAYWDWVASGQKRTVAVDLLRLASVRADQIRRENKLGAQPGIAVVETDQEVQRRRGALIKAERDLQKAAFKLAAYLWKNDGAPDALPSPEVLPPTMPTPVPLAQSAVQDARNRAAVARPEIAALALQQEIARWDLRLAENDSKPDVSLVVQAGQDLGQNGIGQTLKAGVSFSVPLNRWEATGRRDGTRAKLAKLDQENALLRRQVALEVEDAASAVNAAEERCRTAVEEVTLSLRLEEGERSRFRAGDSTLFLVNQRERGTAESRARLIDVTAEYHQAAAAFRAASVQI